MSWMVDRSTQLVPYVVVPYTTRSDHLQNGFYYPKGLTGLAFRDDRHHLLLLLRVQSGPEGREVSESGFVALDLGKGRGLAKHEAGVVEREKATHEHLLEIVRNAHAGVLAWLAWLDRPVRCRAARDGECSWSECPQLRDGEPALSGRHCPIDGTEDDGIEDDGA